MRSTMVDTFTLILSHGLLLIAVWRIVQREDLDLDPPPAAAEATAKGD